jgi:hypothetical protein
MWFCYCDWNSYTVVTQYKTANAHFPQQKPLRLFCAWNPNVCVVICFSARNGGITVVDGIDDKIKENGRDTLHLLSTISNWFVETSKVE